MLAMKVVPAEMSGVVHEQQGALASEPRRPGDGNDESQHENEGICMGADAD